MKDAWGSALANAAVLAALGFIAAIALWPGHTQKPQTLAKTLDERTATIGAPRGAVSALVPSDNQDTTGAATMVRLRLGDEERSLARPKDCSD